MFTPRHHVTCSSRRSCLVTSCSYSCCAERVFSRIARRAAERHGVRRERLRSWICRVFGEWTVERLTRSGTPAA